ncbi:MAG: GNAT family N-acetyltransferase [Solirubrobacterales bacterium]
MDEWNLRTATSGDIRSVLALWQVADSLPTATDSVKALEHLLKLDAEALLIAELDSKVIGSLIAAWDGWRGSFYRLAVHPAWRRRGVASSLVDAGEERLRALGAVRLTAIVATDEHAAMGIWRAAGFELQANRSRFVRLTPEQSAPPRANADDEPRARDD